MGIEKPSYTLLEKDSEGNYIFPDNDYNGFVVVWRCSKCKRLFEAVEDEENEMDYFCPGPGCEPFSQTMHPEFFFESRPSFPVKDESVSAFALEEFLNMGSYPNSSSFDIASRILGKKPGEASLEERWAVLATISFIGSRNGLSLLDSIKSEVEKRTKESMEKIKGKMEKIRNSRK